jgi:hypothetical protein
MGLIAQGCHPGGSARMEKIPATQVAPLSLCQDAYLLRECLSHFRGSARSPLVGWIGFEFDTAPDLPRLELALAAVVQRHDVLRAEFTDVFTLEPSTASTIFARLQDLDARSSLFSARICPGVPVHISTVPIEHIECNLTLRAGSRRMAFGSLPLATTSKSPSNCFRSMVRERDGKDTVVRLLV